MSRFIQAQRSGQSIWLTRFLIVWLGQTISLIGSNLTGFALGVWVYTTTGSVTNFSLVLLSNTLPAVLISPWAGALSDRFSRRTVMAVSDSIAGVATCALMLLFIQGDLSLWHIYLANACNAMARTAQWPAYMASVPQLVPAEHLGRVNGLLQLSQAMAQLVAPLLGGWLYVTVAMPNIFLIDLVSFGVALTLLLATRFPPHQQPATQEKRGLFADSWAAWKVLARHRGLLVLTMLIVLGNFTVGSIEVLITPLVLSFAPPTSLGLLMTVGGGGMVLGSLALSVLGAPRRLVWGVIGAELLGATAMVLAGFSQHLGLLTCAAFLYFFSLPFGAGCHLNLLQRTLDPALHGRVFALLGASASLALVAGYSSAGPLADYVFEPLMAPDGLLSASLGRVIGTGPGRGIGLLFLAMGGLTWLAAVAVALVNSVRQLHTDDAVLNV